MLSELCPEVYSCWPAEKQQEIISNWENRQVGSRIVSETDTLRIWHLELQPGERAPFHRHEETYFWTVLGDGKSRSHYHDGTVRNADYKAGDTRHFELRDGDFFVHDLENIGETPLTFVTVEFKA
ncbi:cupin domain-containing protein (plasmid) [Aliisedimentitalea scapharcae]|uniref:Cupin domain-containing protein n=1 Tax=Aliisedimentitalea scapharcae TaxID=1524259 RepID=A0ABZ2Y358_9RHOB